TADVYVLLGDLSEEPAATWTADGRPLTEEFAHERLARMICCDAALFSLEDARLAAECVRDAQIARVLKAIEQVTTTLAMPPEHVVLSGAGEFLARQVLRAALPSCHVVSLAERMGHLVSACGPAHALAILAAEESAT